MPDMNAMPDDCHHDARLLLPWYAAGTLDADDRAAVDGHLPGCRACQAELAAERPLMKAVAPDEPTTMDGWSKLADRLAETASDETDASGCRP